MEATNSFSDDDRWKSDALDEVFRALASAPEVSPQLIYKGARVLRLRLHEDLRASFDIDASLATLAANESMRANEESRQELRNLIHRAIVRYFESQSVVRYELRQSEILLRRKSGPHPRGWDVYWLNLDVRDLRTSGNAPSEPLRIDIAAPELMSDRSVAPLDINGYTVNALTLERIAGEKLRAFLSCLPAYRRKINETTEVERRVKDLYDLAWIVRKRPVADRQFWTVAAHEFGLACESRLVDCRGLPDLLDDWEGTVAKFYAAGKTIPNDVPIEECRASLEHVVVTFESLKAIPVSFELPVISESRN